MTNLITTVGYPGAGKSEVTNVAQELDIATVSMGDQIRARFKAAFETLDEAREALDMEDVTKGELMGEWASNQREMYGNDIVAKWTVEHIQTSVDSNLVVVDGMRSTDELGVFHMNFDDVVVVHVSCPREIRYERLKERKREGEEKLTEEKLRERDKREDDWGVASVIERADAEIENDSTLEEFEKQVSELLRAYQFKGRGGLNRI